MIEEGVVDYDVMAAIQHAVAGSGGEFPAYPTLVDARGAVQTLRVATDGEPVEFRKFISDLLATRSVDAGSKSLTSTMST